MYDAYTLFKAEGLLAPYAHSRDNYFTVTGSNYDGLVVDTNGCLREFVVDQAKITKTDPHGTVTTSDEFIAIEQGVTICPNGLNIINYSTASKITLHSTGDNWVNLFGSISIHGNKAELTINSHYKINCNGCSFPGIEKVNISELESEQVVVSQKGLLSSGTDIHAKSKFINVDGHIKVKSLYFEIYNTLVIFNQIHANDEIKIKTIELMLIHSEISAIGNISLICNGSISNGNGISIKSNSVVTLDSQFTNNDGAIYGDQIFFTSKQLHISVGKVEALNKIKMEIKDKLRITDGSTLKSYGTLEINADYEADELEKMKAPGFRLRSGHKMQHSTATINIEGSKLDVAKDAILNVKEINVKRGGLEIAQVNHKHYHQTGFSLRDNHCTGYKVANEGIYGVLKVGGNLKVNAEIVNNTQSYIGVEGDIIFLKNSQILNEALTLKISTGHFVIGANWSQSACNFEVDHVKADLVRYCNSVGVKDVHCNSHHGSRAGGSAEEIKTIPSTIYVRGKVTGSFTGIENIDKAPVGFSAIGTSHTYNGAVSIMHANHNQGTIANYDPSRVVKPEDLIYKIREDNIQDMVNNYNSFVKTQGSDANSEPFVKERYESMLKCSYGTGDLLSSLGVDKTKYSQIFASPDIEKELMERGMFSLTGLPNLYEFAEVKDWFLQIGSGASATPDDKACSQLKWLLVNAVRAKSEYNLVLGQSINYEKVKEIEVPFAWPVSRVLKDFGPKLVLELYLPESMIRNMPGWFGPALLFGGLDADISGNFINAGITYINDGATILAKNIGLSGTFIVKSGPAFLRAKESIVNIGATVETGEGELSLEASNIYELLILDPSKDPRFAKRSVYRVGGDAYYLADQNIVQQATIIYVQGALSVKAGGNILQESVHDIVTTQVLHTKKDVSVRREVNQYDMVIMVECSIEIDAGGSFVGSGIKMTSGGDVEINAPEVELKSKTAYATNYQSHTKTKWHGKSKTSVTWTTSSTAHLEITSPNGNVYISSEECTFEGVTIQGNSIIKCKKLIDKVHAVTNTMHTTTTKRGLLPPKIPLIDLIRSGDPARHIKENSVIGQVIDVFKMKSPLDLLPAISLISSLPSMKSDYDTLQKAQGTNANPALSLVGAILSKYLSVTVSVGKKQTETESAHRFEYQSNFAGNKCAFIGVSAYIQGRIECEEELYIEFGNIKLEGAKDRVEYTHTESGYSYDQTASLSGLSAGISMYEASSEFASTTHKPAELKAKHVTVIVNDKLDIEGAVIEGKIVEVSASRIEIKQVLNKVRQESESVGMSVGVTFGAGGIAPYGSFSSANAVKQSELVEFISGISGESVSVTAKHLMYNIAAIIGSENLKVQADTIEHTDMPEGKEIDREVKIMLSVSIEKGKDGGKGKVKGSVAGSYKDGDFVISGGYFTAFSEGVNLIKRMGGASEQEKEDALAKQVEELEQETEDTQTTSANDNEEQTEEGREKAQDGYKEDVFEMFERIFGKNEKVEKEADQTGKTNKRYKDASIEADGSVKQQSDTYEGEDEHLDISGPEYDNKPEAHDAHIKDYEKNEAKKENSFWDNIKNLIDDSILLTNQIAHLSYFLTSKLEFKLLAKVTDIVFIKRDVERESVASQLPGRDDGLADAYRHLLLSAEFIRNHPDFIAKGELYTVELASLLFRGKTSGSELDLYNNKIGIKIGEYVERNRGSWSDVKKLTQEAIEKSFIGYDLKSNDRWIKHIGTQGEYYTTNSDKIKLDNGLELNRVGVLHPNLWKKNPIVNGERLSTSESNWPKGDWNKRFVYE